MGLVRAAIIEDRFPQFLKAFLTKYFNGKDKIPGWAKDALRSVNVEIA